VIYFGRFISETRPIPADFDAIISNAGGCGSHLRAYGHLLHDDPAYAQKASAWLAKLRDIHEYLVEIQFRPPSAPVAPAVSLRAPHPAPHCAAHPAAAATAPTTTVTYHESCHLCHGQQVSAQPRAILRALPEVLPTTVSSQEVPCSCRSEIPYLSEFTAGAWWQAPSAPSFF
jgi:Fe-S oxidoreductase